VKRWQRIALRGVLALGALILLLGGGFYWLALSAMDGLCGNSIVATELSPDRAMKAVLFERDCGATTGFSSQVSVLRADDELPNEGGNVFAANEGIGGEATSWGGPFVALQWRDARTLLLKYDASADVRFRNDRVREIKVVLEKQP
jgi:hypothetical protein